MCDKEDKDMDAILEHNPSRSLEKSLKEMKLMRQGKKQKQSWRESFKKIQKDIDEGRL